MITTHDSKVWDTYVANISYAIQGHTMNLNFQVMHMDLGDVVLGAECLHNLGPVLKQSYKHSLFMYEDNGTHVLLLGEKNVPSSPLIRMAKITSNSNEIDEVFLCYSLCHVLSNVSFYANDDECDDTNENAKFSKKHNVKSNLSFPSHVTQSTTSTFTS